MSSEPSERQSCQLAAAHLTSHGVELKDVLPAAAAAASRFSLLLCTCSSSLRSDRLLVHRVRAISRSGGDVEVITQGDANTVQESWKVAADGTIGTVAYRVPLLGFATGWINSVPGRIGLLIVPGLLLAFSFLARIWRPRLGSGELR